MGDDKEQNNCITDIRNKRRCELGCHSVGLQVKHIKRNILFKVKRNEHKCLHNRFRNSRRSNSVQSFV